MIEISEGRTNNYLVQGVILMVVVIILFVASNLVNSFIFIPTALLFIVALFLFAATNGLEIDPAKQKYRKYGKIGPIKFGSWNSFTEPTSATLMLHSSNAQKGNLPLMGKVTTLDSKALTYDIFVHDSIQKSILIYDFIEYKTAKKALAEIAQAFDIPVIDKVSEKLIENKMKRRARR